MTTVRDDDRALLIGRAVLAIVAALGAGLPAAPATYDAHRLPPGATRDAYLRRHRARTRAGVTGWTCVGQARVVTAEAWQADVDAETTRTRARRRTSTTTPANDDVSAALDRELGIRVRGAR